MNERYLNDRFARLGKNSDNDTQKDEESSITFARVVGGFVSLGFLIFLLGLVILGNIWVWTSIF